MNEEEKTTHAFVQKISSTPSLYEEINSQNNKKQKKKKLISICKNFLIVQFFCVKY